MKFKGIEITTETYGQNKGQFKGTIRFESNNNDSFYLRLNNEFSKKIIEICLPIFEEATKEKLEFIRNELELEVYGEIGQ